MRHKISKTLRVRDGKLYLDSILKEDCYLPVLHFKMMLWSYGL